MSKRKSGSSATTTFFAVGSLFVLIGLSMLQFWAKPILRNAKESVNWPTVVGVITESKVGRHSGDNGTTYSADVTYKYTVNETTIHCDRIWFGDNYSASGYKQFAETVSRYPVGDEVTVYYQADDPFIAVLEPGAVTSSYIGFIVGWGILLLGCAVLCIPIISFVSLRSRDDKLEKFTFD